MSNYKGRNKQKSRFCPGCNTNIEYSSYSNMINAEKK